MIANFKVYEPQSIHKKRMISKNRIYYLKQKLSGIALIIIGVLCPFICDGDVTISTIIIPMGVYLFVTKQRVMNFKI